MGSSNFFEQPGVIHLTVFIHLDAFSPSFVTYSVAAVFTGADLYFFHKPLEILLLSKDFPKCGVVWRKPFKNTGKGEGDITHQKKEPGPPPTLVLTK